MGFLDKLKEHLVNEIEEVTGVDIDGDGKTGYTCPVCGIQLEPGVTVCPACGAVIEQKPAEQPAASACQSSKPSATAPYKDPNYVIPSDYFYTGPLTARFEEVLKSDFAKYAVTKNVAAANIGLSAATPCKPYDLVMSIDGKPKAVIMLTPKNKDTNFAFKNARAAAANNGVKFINFFMQYPNEKAYIVKRIKEFL